MNKLASIFLVIVTGLAIFISLNSFLDKSAPGGQVFQFVFIPITIYLVLGFASHLTFRSPVFGSKNIFVQLLTFYCLAVTCTLVVAGFMASRSASDMVSAIVFAPLAVFFLVSIWPHANPVNLQSSDKRHYTPPTTNPKFNGKFDENRRDFLKMIGTAGISIFLYNLIFRRDANPLFGSFGSTNSANPLALKNAQGEVINPAESSPTQGYYISQIDDGDTSYFGFINSLGQWYVMRQDIDNSYRYSRGDKDFSSNWANRTQLSYDSFDNVF